MGHLQSGRDYHKGWSHLTRDEAQCQCRLQTDQQKQHRSCLPARSYCLTTTSLGITGQWVQWLLLDQTTIPSRVSVSCSVDLICLLSLQRTFSLSVMWSSKIWSVMLWKQLNNTLSCWHWFLLPDTSYLLLQGRGRTHFLPTGNLDMLLFFLPHALRLCWWWTQIFSFQ